MHPGHAADGVGEHVEVLLGGVQHGDGVGVEQLGEQLRVDGERVDEGDAAGPGDLDQRQAREVGALAMELGVEGVSRLDDELVDEIEEVDLVVDPTERHDGYPTSDASD